jgi:hypothetical protein
VIFHDYSFFRKVQFYFVLYRNHFQNIESPRAQIPLLVDGLASIKYKIPLESNPAVGGTRSLPQEDSNLSQENSIQK